MPKPTVSVNDEPPKPRLLVTVVVDFRGEKPCDYERWPDPITPKGLFADALNFVRIGEMTYNVCPRHYDKVLEFARELDERALREEFPYV